MALAVPDSRTSREKDDADEDGHGNCMKCQCRRQRDGRCDALNANDSPWATWRLMPDVVDGSPTATLLTSPSPATQGRETGEAPAPSTHKESRNATTKK